MMCKCQSDREWYKYQFYDLSTSWEVWIDVTPTPTVNVNLYATWNNRCPFGDTPPDYDCLSNTGGNGITEQCHDILPPPGEPRTDIQYFMVERAGGTYVEGESFEMSITVQRDTTAPASLLLSMMEAEECTESVGLGSIHCSMEYPGQAAEGKYHYFTVTQPGQDMYITMKPDSRGGIIGTWNLRVSKLPDLLPFAEPIDTRSYICYGDKNKGSDGYQTCTLSDLSPGMYYIFVYHVTDEPNDPYGYTLTLSESLCPGDINNDGIVDIFDALILSAAFGSSPGDPNWNLDADIKPDGIIDIFDAITLSGVFGNECEVPQATTTIPPGDNVAVYNLDEGSGTTIHDSSGYGNDGTISNPEWVSGRSGYALHFTQENQYIIIPHDESLNPGTGDFTVEAWIKGTDPWVEISKLAYGHGYSLVVVSVGSTAYIQFTITDGVSAGPMYTFPLSNLNDGNWHHVVGSREGDTVKVYFDDVLRASEYAPGLGDVSSDTNLIIGSSYEAEVTIDEVKIKKTGY